METYQGALLIILSIFDWNVWRILVLDGLLHPHSSIPYVQMGRSIVLYTVSLLSKDSCERVFISQPMLKSHNCACLSEKYTSLRQLNLHATGTASFNTQFCRPSQIIFSHINKFQFVYVFRFLDDRPQYGGVHKDFQRVEVQMRFVASESNFPHSRRLCLIRYVWW